MIQHLLTLEESFFTRPAAGFAINPTTPYDAKKFPEAVARIKAQMPIPLEVISLDIKTSEKQSIIVVSEAMLDELDVAGVPFFLDEHYQSAGNGKTKCFYKIAADSVVFSFEDEKRIFGQSANALLHSLLSHSPRKMTTAYERMSELTTLSHVVTSPNLTEHGNAFLEDAIMYLCGGKNVYSQQVIAFASQHNWVKQYQPELPPEPVYSRRLAL